MNKIQRKKIVIAVLVFLIGSACLILLLQVANNKNIAWGIKIANFRIGGNNINASQNILNEKWNNFANQEILLIYQENKWPIKLADLGFQIDALSSANQAFQISRQSNILVNQKSQLAALIGIYNLSPVYNLNQEQFQNQTSELFKNVEQPAKNASLFFNEEINDFSLQHSNQGTSFNREKLLEDLSERINIFSTQSISLEMTFDYPSIENSEVDSAREKAQKIISNEPYSLAFENKSWTINKQTLLDWIKFEPIKERDSENEILGLSLDNDKIEKYLSGISITIDRLPVNAQLKTENNKAIIFNTGREGFTVKKERTINRLTENILSDNPIKKTNIIADTAMPEIRLWQTNDLGINELIGQGISNFGNSPANRIHNIKTGMAKLNNMIINPDQEFSFNNLLGESGPYQGYLPELVIKNNQLIPEYGGGLCQVSTTFFRVAVNSGLKITERYAHAFPITYYAPHGFDATVYDPKPDLRFINNTSGHILFQAIVQSNQLTVNIYGTNDGRKTKVIGPTILESNEDGSMKTILTQEVYLKGELIDKQDFYSNYKSPNSYTTPTSE